MLYCCEECEKSILQKKMQLRVKRNMQKKRQSVKN